MRNISNTFITVQNHLRLVSIFEGDDGGKFARSVDGVLPVDRSSVYDLKKEKEDMLVRMESMV